MYSVALALGYEFEDETQIRYLIEPVAVAFRWRWAAAEFRSRSAHCLSWLTSALTAELGAPTGDVENPNDPLYELAWHFFRRETDIVHSVAEDIGVDIEAKGAELIALSLRFSRRFQSGYPQRAESLASWLAA